MNREAELNRPSRVACSDLLGVWVFIFHDCAGFLSNLNHDFVGGHLWSTRKIATPYCPDTIFQFGRANAITMVIRLQHLTRDKPRDIFCRLSITNETSIWLVFRCLRFTLRMANTNNYSNEEN